MLILSIVGVALVVFGALLLLKFPDRPGGDIAFGTAKVSSKSAGLPIVVLGVACLVLAVRGAGDGGKGVATPTPTPTPTTTTPTTTPAVSPTLTPSATPTTTPNATPTRAADDPPANRSTPTACGPDPKAEDFSAVAATVQLDEGEMTIPTGGRVPNEFRLRLFDGEEFIGVVDLKPRPTGDGRSALFRVVAARDGDCRTASFINKAERPGGPTVLLSWDTGRLIANGASYEVRLGFEPAGGIKIQNFIKLQ